jgi:hypothetical protein
MLLPYHHQMMQRTAIETRMSKLQSRELIEMKDGKIIIAYADKLKNLLY